jgi:hemerythrin-like domain-containing protein
VDTLTVLRRQHDEISALLLELHNQVARYRGPAEAQAIVLGFSRLTRLLRSHLALEDDLLYPAMIRSQEPCASEMAESFASEMGGLAAELAEFQRRWGVSAVVAASFDRFREDAFTILAAIDRRIDREDSQLFPAAATLSLYCSDTAA